MIYKITGSIVSGGKIDLPASKSICNRLLVINKLCNSPYIPTNISDSDDTRVLIEALETNEGKVDIGAAGTSMRFMTAYLAQKPGKHILTGSERMKKRPIALLVEALRKLGAKISYAEAEGFPPLIIEGRELHGCRIDLPGHVSSQYISALMMIAPVVSGGIEIHLEGKVISRPYVNMTLNLMRAFGIDCVWNNNVISIPEGNYEPREMRIEADWSAASYWYSVAALSPAQPFDLMGLDRESLQGDIGCVEIAAHLGVTTTFIDGGVRIVASGKPTSKFVYDFCNQPDLAQTFVVLCCLLGTTFKFSGLDSLKIKETDRITALVNEMAKLGFVLETNRVNTIEWNGRRGPASQLPILTYKDHRMAMSFAPAALRNTCVLIDEPTVVTKSYPRFWDDMKSIGFNIEEIE